MFNIAHGLMPVLLSLVRVDEEIPVSSYSYVRRVNSSSVARLQWLDQNWARLRFWQRCSKMTCLACLFLLVFHPGYLDEYLVLACGLLQWASYAHPNPGEVSKVGCINLPVEMHASGSFPLWQLWGYSDYFKCLKLALRNSPLISAIVNRPWDFVSRLWRQTIFCKSCN